MPFKSKAQRRKFAQLLVDGKISDETYEEWNRSTGRKELPERVGKKAAKRPARQGAAKKRPAKKRAATKERPTRKRAATRRAPRKTAAKRSTRRG
jgi:hypothetical protein